MGAGQLTSPSSGGVAEIGAWLVLRRVVLLGCKQIPDWVNADRRAKLPKPAHRVTNWTACNERLRQRGDLMVWVSDVTLGMWSAPPRTVPDRQRYEGALRVAPGVRRNAV